LPDQPHKKVSIQLQSVPPGLLIPAMFSGTGRQDARFTCLATSFLLELFSKAAGRFQNCSFKYIFTMEQQ